MLQHEFLIIQQTLSRLIITMVIFVTNCFLVKSKNELVEREKLVE